MILFNSCTPKYAINVNAHLYCSYWCLVWGNKSFNQLFHTMKNVINTSILVVFLMLSGFYVQGQTCTMEVVYNAGVGTETDYQNNASVLTSCLESYLLTNNSLTTTATMTNATGGSAPVVTVQYTLPNAADSTTILGATSGGPFPFGFGMINCLNAGHPPIDGFGFTSQIVSFSVNCGSTTPVPTLSQWGIIIFGLLVLCIGGVIIWQRSHSPQRMKTT